MHLSLSIQLSILLINISGIQTGSWKTIALYSLAPTPINQDLYLIKITADGLPQSAHI